MIRAAGEGATARVPKIALSHRWSGQVIETPDGLPYIGKMAEHQYAATGFAGNGMTFGTLAAMMIADVIHERKNWDGPVRSRARGHSARPVGLSQGKHRLLALHDAWFSLALSAARCDR